MSLTNINRALDILTKGIFGWGEEDLQVDMYSFLRDNMKAQTIGEAMDAIRNRKIEKEIVVGWVEMGYCITEPEYSAVKQGYPELSDRLDCLKEKYRHLSL